MTEIYAVLAGVTSYKELVEASSTLLGGNAFASLEEHMVKNDIFFSRSDAWTKDVLRSALSSAAKTDKAISDIQKEPEDKRVLHVLQLIQEGMPALSADVQRFLQRVMFS